MNRIKGWLLLAGVLALGLAVGISLACGGGGKEETTAPTATTASSSGTPKGGEHAKTIPIVLTEWKITGEGGAAIPTIKAGEVTFEVHNEGQVPHEMVMIKSDTDPAALPKSGGDVDEEAAGAIGEVEEFAGGKIETGTFTLEPGKYALICNIEGHYAQGMHAQLIVE